MIKVFVKCAAKYVAKCVHFDHSGSLWSVASRASRHISPMLFQSQQYNCLLRPVDGHCVNPEGEAPPLTCSAVFEVLSNDACLFDTSADNG